MNEDDWCDECGIGVSCPRHPLEVARRKVCGDVEAGDVLVLCECGLYRASQHPHGYVAPEIAVVPLSAAQAEGIARRVRMGQPESEARAAVVGGPENEGGEM